MTIDLAQRQRALDPNTSFIVQAPAGSGKTELLVQRFLVLLSQAENYPEEIIALTFTRKAAAEMRERVMQALEKARQPAPETTHAIKTWQLAQAVLNRDQQLQWNLLDNPHRLRIQTIDALCASLTRRLPLLSGLGGEAAILSDTQACYVEATRRFMNDLAESQSPALKDLLLHLDNQIPQLENLFILLLKRRDQWLPHLLSHRHRHDPPAFRKILEEALQQIVIDILQSCHNTFPQQFIPEIVSLLNFACEHLPTDKNHLPLAGWQYLTSLPSPQLDHLASWQAIADLLLTSDETWRIAITKNIGFPSDQKSAKARFKQLLEDIQPHETLRKSLISLKNAPPVSYTSAQWQIISAITEILPLLAANLRLIFQEQNGVDFLEIALGALQGLGEKEHPSDLALMLDYQIRHLLVDEFQDTSTTQFRLLEKLTAGWEAEDGRSLFLVGDPMQSIYRFREAEVGLFLKAQHEGIGHLQLESLQLSANFRSDPSIINWINQYFPKLFSSTANILSGSVPYHLSTPMKESTENASVKLYPFLNPVELEQEHCIMQIIQNALQENPQQSIAILVRQRNHFRHIIPLLKTANISFSATEIESIAEQSIVLDLFALTSALLNLGDRLSWLAMLRAPFCGLILADLHALANTQQETPLLESLKNFSHNQQLSSEGKERLNHILPIILHSINQRGRCSLRQWVENTWRNLRGPSCLRSVNEQIVADNYFDLLEQWNGSSDISDFENNIKKLRISPITASGTNVHLLTIHKAKGLEFDHVIIPHLEGKGKAADSQLLLWLDRPRAKQDNDLILAAIKSKSEDKDDIYQYLRRLDQEKSKHELVRVLYVGVTRSKKNLHLLAAIKSKNDEGQKPNTGSFLDLLWEAFQITLKQESTQVSTLPTDTNKTTSQKILQRLFLSDLAQFQPTVELQKSTVNLAQENPSKRHIGSIIHQQLQQMSSNELADWSQEKIQQQQSHWEIALLQAGIDPLEIKPGIQLIQSALINCLEDPRAQWILSNEHSEQQNEWPLTLVIDKQIKHIVIDRTFVDKNNVRWIIDYKTGHLPEESPENFLTQQQLRYQQQLHIYAQAVQALDTRPIRLGLYFPLWKGWREWAFN